MFRFLPQWIIAITVNLEYVQTAWQSVMPNFILFDSLCPPNHDTNVINAGTVINYHVLRQYCQLMRPLGCNSNFTNFKKVKWLSKIRLAQNLIWLLDQQHFIIWLQYGANPLLWLLLPKQARWAHLSCFRMLVLIQCKKVHGVHLQSA